MPIRQVPSIILPLAAPSGFEIETVNNLVTHTSLEFPTAYLQEKQATIMAVEAVAAGVPGNLWCWVELSPLPSANIAMWPVPLPTSTAYWAAIGGGGGTLPPLVPTIEVAAGVNGRVHTLMLTWTIHSEWARIVIQTPVAAALPNAFWVLQVLSSAKTP